MLNDYFLKIEKANDYVSLLKIQQEVLNDKTIGLYSFDLLLKTIKNKILTC